MTTDLVCHALGNAVLAKRPRLGLIHHSDRGAQYCAYDYQDRLRQLGLIPSMSRKGNCYDTSPRESFWGTLKAELVPHRRYDTREQAWREITAYIEVFYKRQRRHSRLGIASLRHVPNSRRRETVVHGVHYRQPRSVRLRLTGRPPSASEAGRFWR